MRYVKWTLIAALVLLVSGFLNYTLPSRDVVRIVGTEVRRIDFGENSIFWAAPDVGNAAGTSRDIRFINTIDENGRPRIFRNEDTGWGWPPYFKIDSSNLQAEAENLISTEASPRWVAVTYYGWRSQLLTIFPNAVAVKPVDSPDVRLIPWVSILILTALAGMGLLLWRMWAQFRERTIDPALDRAGDAWDRVDDTADEARSRLARWWHRWTGPPRR